MVAVQKAYSKKWSIFLRGAFTAGTILLGFIAVFFSKTPTAWNPAKNSQYNLPADFFGPSTAHADYPSSCSSCSDCGVSTDGDGGGGGG